MKTLAGWAARHRKLLVGAAGFILTYCVQQFGAGNAWVALAVGVATAAGIWRAPNRPPP